MPRIERNDIDALNLSLTVTLEKEEIKKRYNGDMSRLRQKASVKGFRPGKTPEMMLKKMYGEQVFMDALNDMMGKAVTSFIQDNELDLLGQPIPAVDTPKNIGITQNKIDDMSFKFDMGVAPKVTVKGIDKSDTYTRYAPIAPQDWIDSAFESDRKKNGERTQATDAIQENDVVKIAAKEVKGSHESNFSVLVEMLTDDAKDLFKQHKQGDSFQLDLNHLEKDSTPERVRRYFLNLEDGDDKVVGDMFQLTIEEVTRVTMAELNAEYFEKSYGPGITNEAEAKAFITNEYAKYFQNDTFGLMVRDIQRSLIEKNNDIALPDEFLKRWLLFANPKNTEELIEAEYPAFAKNLRWDLVRDSINAEHNIRVTNEDVVAVFKDKVRGMYGGQFDESIVDMLAGHVMEDVKKKNKKEYDEAVETAQYLKFFNVVTAQVTINEEAISIEDFNVIREKAMAQANIERQNSQLEENIAETDEAEYEEI